MSSGKGSKIFQDIMESSFKRISEREFNLSKIVIPFSKIFKTYTPRDIYSGTEKIPFREREHEFKMIFSQEFSEFLR